MFLCVSADQIRRASLHRRVACFRLIFCRALCSAMERVFRYTGSFCRPRSRHSLRISTIVSSCGSRCSFFVKKISEPYFAAECAVALVNSHYSGDCICMIGLILEKSTAPVHWMRRACSHGVLFRCTDSRFFFGRQFLPVTHRLNSLPPPMLCFRTRSQICQLIFNGIYPHIAGGTSYPAYLNFEFFRAHFAAECAIAFVTTPKKLSLVFFRLKNRHVCFEKRLPPNHPSAELVSTIDAGASTRVPRSASSSAVEFLTSPVCSLTHRMWSCSFF